MSNLNRQLMVAVIALALAHSSVGAMAEGVQDNTEKSETYRPLAFSWSGPYAGVNIGNSWADMGADLSRMNGNQFERLAFAPSGLAGGAQFGYLEQFGRLVAGFELAFAAGTADETRLSYLTADRARTMSMSNTYEGVLRLGLADERWLVYAKAGIAISSITVTSNIVSSGQQTSFSSKSETGWVVGGGLEYALGDNMSVAVDYSYVKFDPEDRLAVQTQGSAGSKHTGLSADIHIVSARLNYKFSH